MARKAIRNGRVVYVPENRPDKFFYSLGRAELEERRAGSISVKANKGAYEKRTGRRWDPVAQARLVERSFETLPNGAPRYYFSLHEVDRFGVNPRAEYGTTPLGVYAYPLTPQYLALLLSRGLPYAEDAEHVTLVEAVKPDRLLYLNTPEARRVYESAGSSPKALNVGLRRLGYTAVSDPGTGTIHRNEPAQAVFLVPSAYRVVARLSRDHLVSGGRSSLPADQKTAEATVPMVALRVAKARGPTDDTRKAAIKDPMYASLYALHVDKGPRDDTRRAAMKGPEYIYWYALNVDKGPREDTRKAASKDPKYAVGYALNVDKGPHNDTRRAVLRDPEDAYEYAQYVDKGPHNATRKAAMKEPEYAFEYALSVDKGPRDDTRKAASKDPEYAYAYARYVDKEPHNATRKAASKDPEYAYWYAQYVEGL